MKKIIEGTLYCSSGFSSQESGWTKQGENIRNESLEKGSSSCCVIWIEFRVM